MSHCISCKATIPNGQFICDNCKRNYYQDNELYFEEWEEYYESTISRKYNND